MGGLLSQPFYINAFHFTFLLEQISTSHQLNDQAESVRTEQMISFLSGQYLPYSSSFPWELYCTRVPRGMEVIPWELYSTLCRKSHLLVGWMRLTVILQSTHEQQLTSMSEFLLVSTNPCAIHILATICKTLPDRPHHSITQQITLPVQRCLSRNQYPLLDWFLSSAVLPLFSRPD
jgi:hypothetical protein